MQQVVDEVVGTLLPLLKEKPFALFGHRYDNKKLNLQYFVSLWSPFLPISNNGSIYTVIITHMLLHFSLDRDLLLVEIKALA